MPVAPSPPSPRPSPTGHARSQERLAWSKKMLLPNAKFLDYWLALLAPIIVYNVFFVPIDVMIMEKEGCDWQCYMEYAFDFLFFVDMIINFRTAYFNDDSTPLQPARVPTRWKACSR